MNREEQSRKARIRNRKENWKGGIVRNGKDIVSLGTYPRCNEDVARNLNHLEQLRAIFYPTDRKKMDRTFIRVRRLKK